MKSVVSVWKPVGISPLEAIQIFKHKYSEYRNETTSYAGRLDPMAEGVLVLLIGEENKNREKYLNLKKEYESEIVLGISTDTFDSLGIIENFNFSKIQKDEIVNKLEGFKGKQKQLYPPYSSKTVEGKPLYWWARKKRIKKIKIPEHEIEIYSISLINFEEKKIEDIIESIIMNIKKVDGDFRQKEIINKWNKFRKVNAGEEMTVVKIKVSCSSGTYIRRIASDLGEEMGIGAFAYSIKRNKVGDIRKSNCINLEI